MEPSTGDMPSGRVRNSALVTRRKIRFRSETLAWAIFAQRAPILCGKRDVAVVAQNLFLECAGACTIDGLRGPVADVNILDVDFVCEADK